MSDERMSDARFEQCQQHSAAWPASELAAECARLRAENEALQKRLSVALADAGGAKFDAGRALAAKDERIAELEAELTKEREVGAGRVRMLETLRDEANANWRRAEVAEAEAARANDFIVRGGRQ